MGLWAEGSGQYLDCTSLANSFAAFDAALTEIVGTGVVSGMVVSAGSGIDVQVSSGVALVGHLLQLAAIGYVAVPGAGTFDIYACQPTYTYSGSAPVSTSYPNSSGIDTAVLTVVATGALPAQPGALLATVAGSGSAITSVNSAPSGRNIIPGPAPTGTRLLAPAQANFTYQPSGSTTTAFLLSEPPVKGLMVFKNGVLVDPSAYTVSGANVTFATAPLSTDRLSAGFAW